MIALRLKAGYKCSAVIHLWREKICGYATALYQDNTLVVIEDVPSRKTDLTCPYRDTSLMAKKGRVNQHHFAQLSDTCYPVIKREASELPTLPLYDSLDIFLSGKELDQLKNFGIGISRITMVFIG